MLNAKKLFVSTDFAMDSNKSKQEQMETFILLSSLNVTDLTKPDHVFNKLLLSSDELKEQQEKEGKMSNLPRPLTGR